MLNKKEDKMKRFLIVILALALTAPIVHAQSQREGQRPNKEEMAQMQVKRIAKALALDNTTADSFGKTFIAYKNECNKVKEKYPVRRNQADADAVRKGKKGESKTALPTDEEVEQQIQNGFARERELLDIKEKYYKEFRQILTPQQIKKMYQMENMPRQRSQNGNIPGYGRRPGGFQGGQMGGEMNPPGEMW